MAQAPNPEARASGGPVVAGRPYIVGERGPELIFPNRSGYVATAGQTAALLSGSLGPAKVPASNNQTSMKELGTKLDRILKALQQRPAPTASANIHLGSEATTFDAMEAALAHQRAVLRSIGL